LGAKLDALYPEVAYAEYSLPDRTRTTTKTRALREDPRIALWITSEMHRYRYVRWQAEQNRYVGLRPA
ncbi:MAG: hypothetical protein AAF762_07285, partial [Pseudomonadota bacterium]